MDSESFLSALMHIYKYRSEVEEKYYRGPDGQCRKVQIPTDRAVLAQRKVLLRDTIGRGTYSKVKSGFDLEKFQHIAVKIIDKSKAPQDFQEKFLPREIEVWKRVKHQNIIKMHDHFRNGTKIYLILEYANGGDMLSHIQAYGGPISEPQCKKWMSQLCGAVKYLHERDIIHRDLKLENLLLDSQYNVKICDFGFCKDLQKQNEIKLSETYCGSKAYASPEILLGEPYDPKKADVWAIGVIFFIFLTGNMPFKEHITNENILSQQKSLKNIWYNYPKAYANAKGLVKSIFTFEWTKRPSIYDILNSEFLLINDSSSTENTPRTDYNLRCRNKLVKTMDKRIQT